MTTPRQQRAIDEILKVYDKIEALERRRVELWEIIREESPAGQIRKKAARAHAKREVKR